MRQNRKDECIIIFQGEIWRKKDLVLSENNGGDILIETLVCKTILVYASGGQYFSWRCLLKKLDLLANG